MPVYKTDKIKDGKQQYRVIVNYTDSQGKYRQKTRLVYGASEAKYEEILLNEEISQSKPVSSLTINKLYEEYMTAKKYDVRATSYDKSRRILNLHVLTHVGDVNLKNLNSKKLQEWKNTINDKDLAIKTKQNIYKEFHALLNYAVKIEYIQKNPLNLLGNFQDVYFTKSSDTIQFYTPEEFLKFIKAAEKHRDNFIDNAFYVFFNVAFYTGMRKGEINALKWSDIENNIIHVRRSIAQKIKGGDIETPPKNKSSYRDLQIPLPLIAILDEHKKLQKSLNGFKEDFRVCGGPSCLRDSSISNRNIQYSKEAGVKTIRIHDFRHSHVSLLAHEGINIQEIARRMGHSDISMTWNTYSHLYPAEEERALKVLNKIK